MNKKYNLKLDLQFRCNNSTMKFDEFDNNTSDFFIRVTRAGELIDISKAIVTLVVIKPDNSVDAQFVDIDSNRAYCDLKPTMKNLVGKYEAIASITVDGETVNTGIDNPIIYEVTENKFLRQLNQKVVTEERFTLLTDMINRLSTIEISEEQRVISEAERILSEENRKIEEAKRVEVELIRQHEEADRTKYDAIRESNENIRKINEEARISSENVRLENEANRIEQEANRVKAEQLRKDNYNFMTEDEERRRSEANAHKEAEVLRVQAETNRVNEEAKRRATEQARVSAENTRVSNENTREASEVVRKNNETQRVEAETQRQNRYNSFIADAEANANNFENYTNTAKVKEDERKSNELDRKSQEDKRVSNEVERISNENTRKANEAVREKNETSRQYVFENKVNEVDKKIIEINATKDNFVSSINTKVDTKISELDNAKSDMTTTVSNKINEVETRFNALTTSQQQDAEVIDARVDFKGVAFNSLKERIDYTDKLLRDSTISTVTTESDFTTVEATSNGYFEDVKLYGKTLVNLAPNKINVLPGTLREVSVIPLTPMKPNFNYTIKVFNVPSVATNCTVSFRTNDWKDRIKYLDSEMKVLYTTPSQEEVDNLKYILLNIGADATSEQLKEIKLLILEGDHTQNPPSFFEGLKSVDEDTDEVVVSSVKGDGNLIKSRLVFGDNEQVEGFASVYRQFKIPVIKGRTYYLKAKVQTNSNWKDSLCRLYHQSKSGVHTVFYDSTRNTNNSLVDIDVSFVANDDYVVFEYYNNPALDRNKNIYDNFDYLCLTSNPNLNPNTDLVSDKKRLLYYNEETQAWEKPILREWDSIEKHANGKYYYHQRSGEVVLNGSENWNNDKNSSTISPETYRQSIQFNAIDIPSASFNTKTSPNIISDLLPTVIFGDVYSYNHIGISISGTDSIGTHIIINNNFIDVTELKQWLQANNLTLVYQLAQEKVYECTNIDLITYANETNYVVESGVLSPKTTLKVHNNISNVVRLLQKKVSLLESNVKASQEVQDMMILETDMRMLDIELALMDFMPMTLNLGGSNMLRSATYFNFLKNHIINETYEKEYLENVMNKYLATGRINQDEYNELYKMLYPPVYDIELPIEY